MADYKVTDTELTSIANAIRTKGGTQAQLEFPTGFVSAVQAIPTGGGGVVQPLSVTQNGIYNPPSGVDGFNPVTVNVPNNLGLFELLPVFSWNETNTRSERYNFTESTAVGTTLKCMAVCAQNSGTQGSSSDLTAIRSGADGNGSYAVYYDDYSSGSYVESFSSSASWNSMEMICFQFSRDINPVVKELYYKQGSDTYSLDYISTEKEKLLLIIERGGQYSPAYSVDGITRISHVTATGGRFNDVYYAEADIGDEINISIPFSGGYDGAQLFVGLFSVTI